MCCTDDVILGIGIGIGYWYRCRPIVLGIGYASWYRSNPKRNRQTMVVIPSSCHRKIRERPSLQCWHSSQTRTCECGPIISSTWQRCHMTALNMPEGYDSNSLSSCSRRSRPEQTQGPATSLQLTETRLCNCTECITTMTLLICIRKSSFKTRSSFSSSKGCFWSFYVYCCVWQIY